MRCPSCNKFPALNFEDPEVDNGPDIDADGNVTVSIRIYRTSECCGEEMKEAILEMEEEIPREILEAHQGDDHELEVEETGVEQIEEGGGRYAKSYFGASLHYAVTCSCQKEGESPIYEGILSDKVQASGMDEMN